ncbi:MAG: ATP-dependent Clp protease ATP-binding subunit [Elusimicrobia bacterium]|nr:ATP-dependent Clp protease ATP-binding subunit [Elusimicrobiota bacterium]
MSNMTNSPMFLLMAAVIIISGLHGLQKESPDSMPVIFCFAVIGLVIRIVQIRHERVRRKDSKAVIDFEQLQKMDITKHVPWLKENLRGHDDVIDRIASKIQQNITIASHKKSLGAFMLVGPTGTGKTYIGELVAKALYPKSEVMIIRMNQYKSPQDVVTLLGPPPGFQGYEIGGSLTRPIVDNPYRVIILDEFEKAHTDVKHCFYDILDRGMCTEKSSGKTAHFGATVFFATCNSGVERLRPIWMETQEPMKRTMKARDAMAREGFEKALLVRFEDIFLMDILNSMTVAEVACIQISKYWKQYGIDVTYTSPEMLVDTVRRNREFQDYGVRQIASLIQESSAPVIEAARKGGARSVRLGLDTVSGEFQVETITQ